MFSFLSMTLPNNFWLSVSQIINWPTETNSFSYLCPETMRWHLPWFNFMLLFSNHSITSKLSCSSLLIKEYKSLSQAWNVISSTKLQISVYSGRQYKSFKYILKRRGPKTDSWGTLLIIHCKNWICCWL